MNAASATEPEWRWWAVAFACIAAAVGAGIVSFVLGGAPPSYAALNGVALLLLAIPLAVPVTRRRFGLASVITVGAVALLIAALWFGPSLEGVRRWVELGPIRLHAGMLAIPALVAVLPRQRETISLIATAICAFLIWLQPDFAAALALFTGIMFATAGRRLVLSEHLLRLAATGSLIATALRPDPLDSVRFVETALSDGWALNPLLGTSLAITLPIALIAPPWLLSKGNPNLIASGRAVIGAMVGFALAGLLGAYPQPLIGYGASPIIGYGLALAVLRFSR